MFLNEELNLIRPVIKKYKDEVTCKGQGQGPSQTKPADLRELCQKKTSNNYLLIAMSNYTTRAKTSMRECSTARAESREPTAAEGPNISLAVGRGWYSRSCRREPKSLIEGTAEMRVLYTP